MNSKIVSLSELITQYEDVERITDVRNEHYITLSSYGKGAHERIIKDNKYPVPFSGYRVSAGQFIYSRIDARNGAYDIIGPELDGYVVSKDFPVFDIDTSRVLPSFLLRSVLSKAFISQVKRSSFGATNRMRIKEDVFGSYSINIPSLDEQASIIDRIDKVQKIIDLRAHELSCLDELVNARFVEMFGDENNSKNLPVIKIQDVADVQVGVVIKPAQYYTDEANGTKAFRSLNIGEMHIKDSDWVFFNDEGQKKNSKSILRANDLVIVRSGAPGTACVITKEYEGANAIDVIIAHPDMDKVNPLYLCAFTNYPHGKRQINEGTGGAAQQHFNVGKYKEMDLIYPPKHEQDEFVAFVKQVDKSKSGVQKSLDEVQLLFDSLMQKYFG